MCRSDDLELAERVELGSVVLDPAAVGQGVTEGLLQDHPKVTLVSAPALLELQPAGHELLFEFVTQDAHDLALVQNLSGSYDIGGFNIFNQTDVPAQDFNFQVQINDYDNDSFSSSLSQFSVHINDVTF